MGISKYLRVDTPCTMEVDIELEAELKFWLKVENYCCSPPYPICDRVCLILDGFLLRLFTVCRLFVTNDICKVRATARMDDWELCQEVPQVFYKKVAIKRTHGKAEKS